MTVRSQQFAPTAETEQPLHTIRACFARGALVATRVEQRVLHLHPPASDRPPPAHNSDPFLLRDSDSDSDDGAGSSDQGEGVENEDSEWPDCRSSVGGAGGGKRAARAAANGPPWLVTALRAAPLEPTGSRLQAQVDAACRRAAEHVESATGGAARVWRMVCFLRAGHGGRLWFNYCASVDLLPAPRRRRPPPSPARAGREGSPEGRRGRRRSLSCSAGGRRSSVSSGSAGFESLSPNRDGGDEASAAAARSAAGPEAAAAATSPSPSPPGTRQAAARRCSPGGGERQAGGGGGEDRRGREQARRSPPPPLPPPLLLPQRSRRARREGSGPRRLGPRVPLPPPPRSAGAAPPAPARPREGRRATAARAAPELPPCVLCGGPGNEAGVSDRVAYHQLQRAHAAWPAAAAAVAEAAAAARTVFALGTSGGGGGGGSGGLQPGSWGEGSEWGDRALAAEEETILAESLWRQLGLGPEDAPTLADLLDRLGAAGLSADRVDRLHTELAAADAAVVGTVGRPLFLAACRGFFARDPPLSPLARRAHPHPQPRSPPAAGLPLQSAPPIVTATPSPVADGAAPSGPPSPPGVCGAGAGPGRRVPPPSVAELGSMRLVLLPAAFRRLRLRMAVSEIERLMAPAGPLGGGELPSFRARTVACCPACAAAIRALLRAARAAGDVAAHGAVDNGAAGLGSDDMTRLRALLGPCAAVPPRALLPTRPAMAVCGGGGGGGGGGAIQGAGPSGRWPALVERDWSQRLLPLLPPEEEVGCGRRRGRNLLPRLEGRRPAVAPVPAGRRPPPYASFLHASMEPPAPLPAVGTGRRGRAPSIRTSGGGSQSAR